MSDFVIHFPTKETQEIPSAFDRIKQAFNAVLSDQTVQAENLQGAGILRTTSFGRTPDYYYREDGAGWIVVKGIIVDVIKDDPAVDLKSLLDEFLGGKPELNRYEGTFALAAWDARRKIGWLLNDHTCNLQFYYGEFADGVWATTRPLPLAQALGLGLSGEGVQEFLSRGTFLVPTCIFEGLSKIDIGQHLICQNGTVKRHRHWYPFTNQTRFKKYDEAAQACAGMIRDRTRRLTTGRGKLIFDLTAGLDSRLVVSAAQATGLSFSTLVDGLDNDVDVKIAHQIAAKMGWPIEYFNYQKLWTEPISPDIRRELTWRTSGEWPYPAIYHHRFQRPNLAQRYQLNVGGAAGEILRFMPWGQEFFGIGRRQPANVDRFLKYRLLHDGPPPTGLFANNWYPGYVNRIRSRTEAIIAYVGESLTTQQLETLYIWRSTGTFSKVSALFNWLPMVHPILNPGFIDIALSVSWWLKKSTALQRKTVHLMSPEAAVFPTQYGPTASPTSLATLPQQMIQTGKSLGHLISKVERVKFKSILSKHFASNDQKKQPLRIPYITDEFYDFMNPKKMHLGNLIDHDVLLSLLSSKEVIYAKEPFIWRLSTVEQLCRDLDFRPDSDFLK